MNVSKEMYAEEIQPHYNLNKRLGALVAKKWGVKLINWGLRALKGRKLKGYHNETYFIPISSTPDHSIRVRVFKPGGTNEPLPALLYLHGGGYLIGLPEQALSFYKELMHLRKLTIIAPAYRLSLKHPYPAGFNDCYDTLLWMKENAASLHIDPNKIMVAGHSAGGGLTAAVTLKARDTGEVNIAFQMPIYPMIDHRMITESSKMTGAPVWDANNNQFAWKHYLKGLGNQEVPAYASPTINDNYSGFPPTISFVADLEPFKDETINYMKAIEAAGVPTLFELYKGAFHAFEKIASKTQIGKEAHAFQLNAFVAFYDRYVAG